MQRFKNEKWYRKDMPVSSNLIDEIERKQSILLGNPDYYLHRSNMQRHALESSMKVYSWWIEHPDLRKILIDGTPQEKAKAISVAKKGIENLTNAWVYIKNVPTVLDERVILKAAALVDDRNSRGYRETRVTLNLPSYTPPNPLKVPELMRSFLFNVNKGDLHPLEQAANAHLHVAGIQPFRDGNKRLARLIQDKVLYDFALPPAVIPSGEREVYIDLLEQALAGTKEGSLKLQRPFYDYIGGKVNVALDLILDDLKPHTRSKKASDRLNNYK